MKKILISIIIILLLFSIGVVTIVIINNNKTQVNNIDNDNYALQYDKTWKILSEEENKIELLHKKSNSKLTININELEEENQYKEISSLFDDFLYNIQQQNENYNLIEYENAKITKNNLEGYKILFEAEDIQTAIYLYRQDIKLIVLDYESKSESFDIVIDSANNIINSFELKHQNYDVLTNIELETKEVIFSKQDEIVELLKDTKDDELNDKIKTKNDDGTDNVLSYCVNYSIPSNFELSSSGENDNYKIYRINNNNISLSVELFEQNIYDYLDKNSNANLLKKYDYQRDNEEYENFEEALNKYSDEPLSYVYKNSYISHNFKNENITNENIELVYELNKNHIISFKFESQGFGIPEEMIKMIKINSFKLLKK